MNTPITTDTKMQHILDYALELKQQKADLRGAPGTFRFDEQGRIEQADLLDAGLALPPLALNDRALGHACAKLGQAWGLPSLDRQYITALREQAPDLMAANLNGSISRVAASGGWLVRGYADTCRAILSDQYLPIDNDEMLQDLAAILSEDGTEHRISTRSFVNVDNMNVDVMFKDIQTPNADRGGNNQWGLGIRIRNGEVGDWKGGIYPVIKRTSCDNSITIDDRSMSYEFKHFGRKTLSTKRVMIKAAMSEILPFAATLLDKMIEADGKNLPSFGEIVTGLGFKHGWSEEFTQTVFAGTERQETVAGLVNGITYAAHQKPESQEQGVEAEYLAGRLLFDDGRITGEAISITRSQQAREEASARRAEARALRNQQTPWRQGA